MIDVQSVVQQQPVDLNRIFRNCRGNTQQSVSSLNTPTCADQTVKRLIRLRHTNRQFCVLSLLQLRSVP